MASAAESQPDFGRLARKTFRFDWVTSLMLSLIVLTGAIVFWLSAVWVTNQVWEVDTPPVGVEIIEVALDDEEGMAGDDPELGEAQIIDPSNLPAREENLAFDQPEVAQVMANVLEAIAEHEADFADPSRQEGEQAAGRPGRPGGTGKEGTGSGSSAIPRAQRWSIVYPRSQNLPAYARLLDFFGIELGVFRGGELTTVSNFSKGRPIIKRGGPDEDLLYFVWQDRARREADTELLRRAGVQTDNAVIAQFFPSRLEEKLARLELEHAGKKPEEIRTTQFGIRRIPGGYEFFVEKQVHTR